MDLDQLQSLVTSAEARALDLLWAMQGDATQYAVQGQSVMTGEQHCMISVVAHPIGNARSGGGMVTMIVPFTRVEDVWQAGRPRVI